MQVTEGRVRAERCAVPYVKFLAQPDTTLDISTVQGSLTLLPTLRSVLPTPTLTPAIPA